MKDRAYTMTFALIMGVACALLLTGVGEFTKPYAKANAEAEKVRNILGVLGISYAPDAGAEALVKVFEKSVREESLGDLATFVYAHDGERKAVAVPFAGPGLWGPVEGFLSLAPDMRKIKGVTFHKQEETPGLGGEIASQKFRGQFSGKALQDAAGRAGIRITKPGQAKADNEIDGISGATMTCDKVQAMLNKAIVIIVKERDKHEQ